MKKYFYLLGLSVSTCRHSLSSNHVFDFIVEFSCFMIQSNASILRLYCLNLQHWNKIGCMVNAMQ